MIFHPSMYCGVTQRNMALDVSENLEKLRSSIIRRIHNPILIPVINHLRNIIFYRSPGSTSIRSTATTNQNPAPDFLLSQRIRSINASSR